MLNIVYYYTHFHTRTYMLNGLDCSQTLLLPVRNASINKKHH